VTTLLAEGVANLNWHPTVDMKVQSYALEQSTKQLKKENARLSELDAKLNAILSNSKM